MIRVHASLLLAIAGLVSLAAPVASAQLLYCWHNDAGTRLCADSVPPDQVQYDRQVYNEIGVLIREERGELSEEEIAAQEAERLEQQRLAQEEQERLAYESFLLDSHSSVESIENLRDRRVAEIDARIVEYQATLEDQQEDLEAVIRRAQRYAPYNEDEGAPALPDILLRNIEAINSSIGVFESEIENLRERRAQVEQDFERDIALYKELQHTGD